MFIMHTLYALKPLVGQLRMIEATFERYGHFMENGRRVFTLQYPTGSSCHAWPIGLRSGTSGLYRRMTVIIAYPFWIRKAVRTGTADYELPRGNPVRKLLFNNLSIGSCNLLRLKQCRPDKRWPVGFALPVGA
jgi:hypothetical protein